jgi:hypothetical protein
MRLTTILDKGVFVKLYEVSDIIPLLQISKLRNSSESRSQLLNGGVRI